MIKSRRSYLAIAMACGLMVALILPLPVQAKIMPFICTPQYEKIDGRCMYQAYFSGQGLDEGCCGSNGVWQGNSGIPIYSYIDSLGSYMNNTYAIPPNIDAGNPNDATNFVNFIDSYLNPPNPNKCTFPQPSKLLYTGWDMCASYRQEALGAAFIVLTMVGGKYTTYDVGTVFGNNVQTGVNDARAAYDTWKAEVLQADAAGLVEWNAAVSFPANHPNSNSSNWAHDVLMFLQNAEIGRHSIVFHNPAGDYVINRRCGNSVGYWAPLAPPPTPSCGQLIENPGIIDPNKSFTITAEIDYQNSSDANTASGSGDKVAVNIAGPTPSNSFSFNSGKLAPTVSGSSLRVTTVSLGPVAAGTYNASYNIYNASGAALIAGGCNKTFTVTYLPYFNVNGGDVEAGAGMNIASGCINPDGLAGVVSWNQEDTPGYKGAGVQYAAYALSLLQDFATTQVGNNPPETMAFANSIDVYEPGGGGDTFGGGLGSYGCVPQYFKPSASPTGSGNTTINTLPTGGTNTQYITGNVVVNMPAGMIPNGSQTTMYVNGDVYIASDIKFSGNYPNGMVDIPEYNIIASGSIYIGANVTELDGLYVASPTAANADGIIYTCASQSGYTFAAASLNNSLYNSCKTHLDVYGSLIGRQVWLLRTKGTLYADQPAETMTYDPEIWLPGGIAPQSAPYTSISELPPVL